MRLRTVASPAGLAALIACATTSSGSPLEKEGPNPRPAPSVVPLSFEPTLTLDEELSALADSLPEFGGLWVDSARVVVAVTDGAKALDPATTATVNRLLGSAKGELAYDQGLPIEYVEVPFTFRQLHSWRLRFDSTQKKPGLIYTDTDERRNTVSVGVENVVARSWAIQALKALGVPDGAIRVDVVARPRPQITLNDILIPTAGGAEVSVHWTEGILGRNKNGTLTGSVVWDAGNPSSYYFVTCSHCSAKAFRLDPPAQWGQPLPLDSTLVGAVEAADPPFFSGGACPPAFVCRYSEASIVTFPSSSYWSAQVAWAPNAYTRAINSYYPVDNLISAIGNSSYYYTGQANGSGSGTLTQTCVTFTPDYSGYKQIGDTLPSNAILLCQNYASLNTVSGDSGAPVFQIPNPPNAGYAVLRGVLHAGGNGSAVFSPRAGINKDFGVVHWDLY